MRYRWVVLPSLLVAFAAPMTGSPAEVHGRTSGLFCLHDFYGRRTFAFRRTGSDSAWVAFSDWFPNGQHIGIFGPAKLKGLKWVFEERLESRDPADHCRVFIKFGDRRSVDVAGDAKAACKNEGGYGTYIRRTKFGPSNYEKPVTHEFDNAENFFGHAGAC